ncbi:MAG: hypothetical protein CMF74_10595 [Maricaulis sp.]|nr:hypothetical protein [Maricaulis sp.]HAQ36138.1 hypothetical protein [Alphaproteobacteria bacterium]
MRRALAISLALHGAVVVSGFIYIPMAVRPFASGHVVPVDLVTLSDITNVRARTPEPVVETPPVEETPVDEAVVEAPPAEPEPAPAEAEPEAVAPDPTEAEPEPEAAEPEVREDPVTPTQQTPEPRERPEPPRQQPATQAQPDALDLDSLSDLVNQSRDTPASRTASLQGETQRAVGAGTADTATLADLIRSQANRCWRNSRDAPNPERLIVNVQVRLNRDGSLAAPPVAENAGRIRASGDPYWQVAQERALAAIIDCAPYRLPSEQYAQWRLIDVTFRNDTF